MREPLIAMAIGALTSVLLGPTIDRHLVPWIKRRFRR